MAIKRFLARGLSVETLGGNTVAGNFVGTDTTGLLDRGNGSAGIFVNSSNETIDGTTAADRNLISGNDRQGIYVIGATSVRNAISQNSIYQNVDLAIDLSPYGMAANDRDAPAAGLNNL